MRTNTGSLSKGLIVEFEGSPHEVVFVNDCRARIEPLRTRHVEIAPVIGPRATFEASRPGANISPQSEILILAGSRSEFEREHPGFARARTRPGDKPRRGDPAPGDAGGVENGEAGAAAGAGEDSAG